MLQLQGVVCATLVLFSSIAPGDSYVFGTVCNKTNKTLIVKKLKCCSFENLSVGDQLAPNACNDYYSNAPGRIFVWFSDAEKTQHYAIGATCPVFSSNSATGFGNGGLRPYKSSGGMFEVMWGLGEGDRADWSHSNTFTGDFPNIDYCGEVC